MIRQNECQNCCHVCLRCIKSIVEWKQPYEIEDMESEDDEEFEYHETSRACPVCRRRINGDIPQLQRNLTVIALIDKFGKYEVNIQACCGMLRLYLVLF